jgi:glycosyltransferase involved in cell wall biosynthesis
VVPVHNEAAFIPHGLPGLVRATRTVYPEAEILVVENGSTDGTAAAVRAAAGNGVSLVQLAEADYGTAMYRGMTDATGDWIVTFDIDYFAEDFLRRLEDTSAEADIVIASKRDPGSDDRRSAFRRLATLGFNLLLRTLFGSRVSDTHGIKAFRAAATRPHLDLVHSRKDLFDTELILRMERAGARIVEVPVTVEELRPARSSLLRRVPRTLRGLWSIRRLLASPPEP